jgi:hypothetical protein
MDTREVRRLVGKLAITRGTSARDLARLERTVGEHVRRFPNLTVFGNRLSHETVDEEILDTPDVRSSDQVLDAASGPAPLIFRRETAFRSAFIGNSVPDWAVGVEPAQSFGPFLDEHGLLVWFDIYLPATLVSFTFAGQALPVLRATVRRTLVGTQSYRLSAGSLWIASDVIARVAALQGSYTGLRITRGTIELSQAAAVSSGTVVMPPTTTVRLHADLDQRPAAGTGGVAGLDASDAVVSLPTTLDLTFQLQSTTLQSADASCTVFGCGTSFLRNTQAPFWNAGVGRIVVPFDATTQTNDPAYFEVASSKSALCRVKGRARIDQKATGWVLPVTHADPLTLGEAAGIGALGIGLEKGLSTTWKNLRGPATALLHPGIIVEPGLVTLLDFFASNAEGRQRWTLWRNAATSHHSDVLLTFGKLFPFLFVSSTSDSEGVFCFCRYVCHLDRPVDANGRPFAVQSPVAYAATLQTGANYHAILFDTDTLEEEPVSQTGPPRYAVALRNALFTTSAPRTLALFGSLEDDRITSGTLAMTHDIYRYLPTLPDPYVATYTPYLRDRAALGFGRLQQSLTGFVKWPDLSQAPAGSDADEASPGRAFVYYRLTLPLPPRATPSTTPFRTGVATFGRELTPRTLGETSLPSISSSVAAASVSRVASTAVVSTTVEHRFTEASRSGALAAAVNDLAGHPLLSRLQDPRGQVSRALETNIAAAQQNDVPTAAAASTGSSVLNRLFPLDAMMLLDVSSRADQMGVAIGSALQIGRDAAGGLLVSRGDGSAFAVSVPSALPLQIDNMDVVATGQYLRATTLPQISWEPVWNIPLPIEGSPDPLDTVTVTPGPVVYQNDGVPTRIYSNSPYQVPIAPLPVTRHFLKEYNDEHKPLQLTSLFNLPFGMVAKADFIRHLNKAPEHSARLGLHAPHFGQLRGGLQIKALAPASPAPDKVGATFDGWTLQLDNIRWALFGIPLSGSTLGRTVRDIFNQHFAQNRKEVPVEQMELSGYGASIFSNWLSDASIADVSQVQFDVVVGRTAHEVVQVRSILYPFGVHVVRTITLTRSNNGYVFRSDSGWKAETDGFYDFSYTLDLIDKNTSSVKSVFVSNPYEFHKQPVKGVSNVREIRDYPDGGEFNSSFPLNDPDLPPQLLALPLSDWKKVFEGATGLGYVLNVHLQSVVFDADVHLDNVVGGGKPAGSDFVVQSRKMHGYVQLAPSSILIPARLFADLLNFQNGSLGGPVDCELDVAKSKQRMRVSRVDVNPARNAAGKSVFVTAARGSLVLPKDGSWSTVKQRTDTGDVQPVAPQELVPLIKPNASPSFQVTHPADVYVPTSNTHYGVVQSTGTQKLLFDVPQFVPGSPKLRSTQTYFADAYKLLNSKGIFPNIANALGLTNAEREVDIISEGVMKMVDRTLKLETLLPASYTYPFIDEPGVLRIYAQYKTKDNTQGRLTLGIDSAAALADRWKAALDNMRIVVDLGPFPELMWVNGNFKAKSGISTAYDKPHLEFGDVLDPVIKILQILAKLSGDDFDSGMQVGMSNSPDNWEYKFNCSKEIPVIKFPSPAQLTVNPNPPLKLEAGLKVGFYFNEVLAIPTDLKQVVPGCGAYVDFYGRLEVQCFTLAAASIYAVGQVNLGIAADSKAGISLHMKFGFGAEIVVGLPVVANVSVLYLVEVEVDIADDKLHVAGLMLFRGSAEICGGLVGICIQIEAGGSVDRVGDVTTLTAQVTFTIDVCVLWVIDIEVTEHWEEQRQIA